MPEYSICITHYNNKATVRESLESIFSQIDESFEVIVVDNCSTDGSEQILKDYAKEGKIALISKKCSRGVGRETAFERSSGKYTIANLDMDDSFAPKLYQLLDFYHSRCEGNLLLATADVTRWSQNITLGPRNLISAIGGWRNLQWGEDWDIWRRAARKGKYRWTTFNLALEVNLHEERERTLTKLGQRYTRYRDMLALGRTIFDPNEKVSLSQRMIANLAKIGRPFRERFDDRLGPFDPYDKSLYIPPPH